MTPREIQQYGTPFADIVARGRYIIPQEEILLTSHSQSERSIKLTYQIGFVPLSIAFPTEVIVKMMMQYGIAEVKKMCNMATEVEKEDEEEEESDDDSDIQPDHKGLKPKKAKQVVKLRKRG